MPESIPNLAGVATKDLVETIGTGNYKASYINWARTFNLLHQHAPGWYLDMMAAPDGGHVFRAPGNGGYLMLRLCHVDGTTLPPVPQAIMDNRNGSIPFEKISSRDITDTHRRGGCLCLAMTSGLAHELWAKMPMESGYSEGAAHEAVTTTPTMAPAAAAPVVAAAPTETEESFLEAALAKGLTTHSAEALLKIINGNYAGGIKTLASKGLEWVDEQNRKNTPEEPAKPAAKAATASRAKKTEVKPEASEY
jgi:hypothetical protein